MLSTINNPGIIRKSDWSRIRSCLAIAENEIVKGNWEHKKTHDNNLRTDVYSLDGKGFITVSNALDGSIWKFWGGEWLENLLPWIKGFRSEMSKAGLPLSTVAYHVHSYSVEPHRDVQYLGQNSHLPHTNVNYMISSEAPDESYTWIRDDVGNETRYYSHPDKLWIINASLVHAIVTNHPRDALIMKFHHPFDQVENFFKNNPNFFDENQPYFNI